MADHLNPGGPLGPKVAPRLRDPLVSPSEARARTRDRDRAAGEPIPKRPAERRRRFPLWLLLIPLLVMPLLLMRPDRDDDAPVVGAAQGAEAVAAAQPDPSLTTSAAAGELATADSVRRFAEWANRGGNQALPAESEENHPYTREGIRLLADALGEVGATPDRVRAIRARADQLQRAPDDDRHAEYARAAFVDASRLIGELRGGGDALLQAANAIEPDRALSPQGPEVRAYFRRAAVALTARR
jgi:hypothetical protein